MKRFPKKVATVLPSFGRTFKKFHGKSIPFLVVIDKEGIVTYTNDYLQDGFENDLIEKLQLNKNFYVSLL